MARASKGSFELIVTNIVTFCYVSLTGVACGSIARHTQGDCQDTNSGELCGRH
jgi:hypothetical protein